MGVDYKVSQLYDAAIRRIAGSQVEWKQILKLAGQLYRYEFDNILMVYMQRPKATLVADFGTWKKVGRYVRKGSRGIAIFPSRALRAGMRHVFDISDTGGRQQELTWRLHAGNREAYAAYLYQESGIKKTEEQKNQEAVKCYTKVVTGVANEI